MPHWAIPDVPGEPKVEPPPPPRVDCHQPKPDSANLPPNPTTGDDVAWTVWAARVYGYIKLWVNGWNADDECLKDLRSKGVIR